MGEWPSSGVDDREVAAMSAFSEAERTYLAEGKLGRLATIDPAGFPHVVPVGWQHNAELDTIDIGGRNPEATQKFHNAQRQPKVAFVVDDVLPPWTPRCVMIRGTAEAIPGGTSGPDEGAIIRITPEKIVSWGLDEQT
jgi:pyridoxamine 5'-phosphate oxidase family protein